MSTTLPVVTTTRGSAVAAQILCVKPNYVAILFVAAASGWLLFGFALFARYREKQQLDGGSGARMDRHDVVSTGGSKASTPSIWDRHESLELRDL